MSKPLQVNVAVHRQAVVGHVALTVDTQGCQFLFIAPNARVADIAHAVRSQLEVLLAHLDYDRLQLANVPEKNK